MARINLPLEPAMRLLTLIAPFLLGLTLSTYSHAHARWALDGLIKPRNDATGLKTGPCGGVARTTKPTVLEAGARISVKIESVIYHKGVFNINFSAANDQNFQPLLSNIADSPSQTFQTHTLTLPSTPCNACTLQLIQTMPDQGPNSLYYSCADIQIVPPIQDNQPPAAVSELSAQLVNQHVELHWTNPVLDFKESLVLQANTPITALPSQGLNYQVGDAIGNAKVVARSANPQFTTNAFTPGQTLYFAVIAFDAAYNYAASTYTQALMVPPPNLAPRIELVTEQASQMTRFINTQGGEVLIQAKITDDNPQDTHTLHWSASTPALLPPNTQDRILRFDPAQLTPGDYHLQVTVTDSGNPAMQSTAHITLTLEEPFRKFGSLISLELIGLLGLGLWSRKRLRRN